MNNSEHQVEATADRIRDDLLGTLRELDRRRARATDIRFQAQKHMGVVIAAGAAAVVLLAGAIASAVMQRRSRQHKRFQRRVEAMQRAWNHPERLASHAKDRPLHMELLRRVAVAASVAAATEYSRRAVQKTLKFVSSDKVLH